MDKFIIKDDITQIADIDITKYISLPFMTKYEFDQLIGLRCMHLSNGSIPFVDLESDFKIKSNMDLRKVAIRELVENKLPYIIKREIPNSKTEYWKVANLKLDNIKYMMR